MGKDKSLGRKYNISSRQERSTISNLNIVDSVLQQFPAWRFMFVDMDDEEWGWMNVKNNEPVEIFRKLQHYETRRWHEIRKDKKRDHSVEVKDLSPRARNRLRELKLDDYDKLFRLRLSAKMRIWGILDGYKFNIIWLDPHHTVCPCSDR
jgi:hypothetical protein